ncbi:MAG: DUF3828 domain-containing protein [Pyrinomonadaceae bacterium]
MLGTIIKFLLSTLLLTLISCATGTMKNNPDEAGKQEPTPRTPAAKPAATPSVAKESPARETPKKENPAPKTAPEELVETLYQQHDSENSPFFQDKNRALVDKFFTRSTADIIWKDAIDSKGEIGALGADPLYDAQDTDIKNFKIAPGGDVEGDKATVTVTFENFGQKKTIKFLLIKENDRWKISDIDYGEYTLLSFYQETP